MTEASCITMPRDFQANSIDEVVLGPREFFRTISSTRILQECVFPPVLFQFDTTVILE